MEKTSFTRKDSGIDLEEKYERNRVTGFFTLPPELRTQIYTHIFDPQESHSKAFLDPSAPDHRLNETYRASSTLLPLLTNRQFHAEAHLLAFSRTVFAVRNPFTAKALPQRLRTRLPRASQIASIRYIAFVAEADHFRQMRNWRGSAFGVPELGLHGLDIVLFRSSYWHYLFDFNSLVVGAVRELEGVGRVRWCRNRGRVKPHFRTWFNRLVAAMYKVDRLERFGARGAGVGGQCGLEGVGGSGDSSRLGTLEKVAWDWEFDDLAQTASLVARPAWRADLCVEEYDALMAPGLEALARSVAVEEFDPDPRSRNGV